MATLVENINLLAFDIENYRIPASEALIQINALLVEATDSAAEAEAAAVTIPGLVASIEALIPTIEGYEAQALVAKNVAIAASDQTLARLAEVQSAVVKTTTFTFTIPSDTTTVSGLDDSGQTLAVNTATSTLYVDGERKDIATQTEAEITAAELILAGSTVVITSTQFYAPVV